jgi:hypothetical protein
MHWFFNTVTAGISGSVGNAITGTQSISVITSFCLGATTMATCGGSGANFGTLTANIAENASPVLGCGTGSTANYTCSGGVLDISNAQYVTQIAFSTVVTANHIAALGTGAQTVDLNNFSLAFTQFAEAPEPGSYILMGSGLAALGFIARRRRRQA